MQKAHRKLMLKKLHYQYLLNYFGSYRQPKLKQGQIITFVQWPQ